MAKARENKGGKRFTLRGLVDRGLGHRSTELHTSVAAANLNWEDADYDQTSIQEGTVFDPWEPKSQVPQATELALASTDSGASMPNDDFRGITSNSTLEDGQTMPDEAEPTPKHLPDDRDTADQSTDQTANEPSLYHEADNGDEWDDLEAAEEDLAEAQNELLVEDATLLPDDAAQQIKPENNKYAENVEPPIQYQEIVDESLETEWEEDTEGSDDFDAFDSAEDPLFLADGNLGLFDFDEEAQQSPWDLATDDDESSLRRARAKAATITGLLDLTSMKEQDVALRYLTELFEHLRHPATFRALYNAAEEGLDLDTLKAMADLRHIWMQRPEWWLCRYGGYVGHMKHGQAAFTWVLARRVCLARPDFSTDTMIDEEWLVEWLVLPPRAPGYWSFPAFIGEKVNNIEAEALDKGLSMEARHNRLSEFGDNYDWYRRAPSGHEAIRLGFHILTPYDERPGVIPSGPKENERRD